MVKSIDYEDTEGNHVSVLLHEVSENTDEKKYFLESIKIGQKDAKVFFAGLDYNFSYSRIIKEELVKLAEKRAPVKEIISRLERLIEKSGYKA